MDYRRMNDICYIRVDKGEEIIGKLLEVCKTEKIKSATFTGIGGFISRKHDPETGTGFWSFE